MEVGVARPHRTLQIRAPILSWAAPPATILHLAGATKHRGSSWRPAQASSGDGGTGGSPGPRGEPEGSILEDIAALLDGCEQLKAMADSSSGSGVGLDMRNRVDHLLKRVRMLQQNAQRAARAAGGRVPSQLIASFKILQREHGSIENIVRLATEAGPVLSKEAKNLTSTGLSMVARKSSLSMNYETDTAFTAQEHENGTLVEVLSGPKYVMSTPLSGSSFKLNAVRAEIERRVMEHLSRNPDRFDSKEDLIEERESKWESQKVPSVNQKFLEGDKIDVDNAIGTDKRSFPQITNAQSGDKQEAEFGAREENLGNAKTFLLELDEQMCKRFDKALYDLRENFSDVANDLRQRDDTLLDFKENVFDEQKKLLEKINELSAQVTSQLAGEKLSNTLKTIMIDIEKDVNHIQGQLKSLGSDLDMKEKMFAEWQEQQGKLRKEFIADISRLETRLNQSEGIFESFNPQSLVAELESVKVTLTALQKGRLLEKTVLPDWQMKLENLERSLLSNSQHIEMLASEVESRLIGGELKNLLNNIQSESKIQQKEVWESLKCVNAEQMKTASNLEMLREEWKAHRKEIHLQIQDMNDKLTIMETTQNQSLLMEFSIIKDKLSELQEEQKHERSVLSELHQQMVASEEKDSDLLRRMSENAEVQKQDLLEAFQALMQDQLQAAHVHQKETLQMSPLYQQEFTASKDVDFVHSSSSSLSRLELSSIVPKNDQHMASSEVEGQHVDDKGTASLEAFFSVMGHLIREELKKKDGISALNFPSDEGLSTIQSGEMERGPIIVLRYESHWKRAFIHYCVDDLGWTEAPGVAMYEMDNPKGVHWKEFRIAAARLEFVVTDGQGHWDRAPNGHNYLLEKPGIFKLSAGVLKTVASL